MYTDPNPTPTPNGNSGDSLGLVGGLIGVGAGLYDSYQNRKASKENTDKTIAAQKAESELAYQRSVNMWNAQNAYNDPQSQMQRFVAAGLNPHLMYGQGSSGLASSPPQYQPANMQYRYEAPQYGAAVQTMLPTLMAVGTWMQNMRASEVDIKQKQTSTERTQQTIDYLLDANPQLLQTLENRNSIFPYQKNATHYAAMKAQAELDTLDQEFRYKYGEDLWRERSKDAHAPNQHQIGGVRKLEFLQQQSKTKLEQARASWTDFDITNPQAIIQMVLSGVMGMAGQQLKLSTKGGFNPRSRTTHETESRMRGGRTTFRRRTYER